MTPPEPIPSKQHRRAAFRPNFTLSILYLIAFFFLFCMLFLLPALSEFTATIPPGTPDAEAQAMIEEFASKTIRPRLGWMLVAATAVTGLGIYAGFLPGTKRNG